LIVLGVLAAAIAVLVLIRGPLSLAIMRRVIERNIGNEFVAGLPDGLHVVLCGAGGPLPDPIRSGPCVAVVAGKTFFIVDAGSGAARSLGRMRMPPGEVDAVLLTHFHSDDIDGLGELSTLRWAGGAQREPLPVVGPTGVEDVVDGFNRAYGQDVAYRVAHHGEETVPPSGAGLRADVFMTPLPGRPVVVWEVDDVKVTAFAVDHEPVRPAVGYRFDYGGRSVVVSGDTKKSASLQSQAQGVDLLVHEALSERLVGAINAGAKAAGVANIVKITSDIPDHHTTPVEAAEIAEAAGVAHLLYYHVVPPMPLPGLEAVFLEGVDDAYSGAVTVGRDGSAVSLPAGSDAIEVSSQ
jgi:ribonuclease Z